MFIKFMEIKSDGIIFGLIACVALVKNGVLLLVLIGKILEIGFGKFI